MNKLFSWLAVIAVTGFIYWCQPDFFRHAYKIIEHGNIAALADYLHSFGPAAVFAILVLFVVMTFTIVFPFALLEGAGGHFKVSQIASVTFMAISRFCSADRPSAKSI